MPVKIDPNSVDEGDLEDNEDGQEPDGNEPAEVTPDDQKPDAPESTETDDDNAGPGADESQKPDGEPAGEPEPKYGKFGNDPDKMWNSYQQLESLLGSKLNGLTVEQLQEIQNKASQWDKIAGGLPPKPQAGAKPSEQQAKDLLAAAGLNFENIKWDEMGPSDYGNFMKESLTKLGQFIIGNIPATLSAIREQEEADAEELKEGAKLDKRLDTDKVFRDRVADKLELNIANGDGKMTVAQAVVAVQEEYRLMNTNVNDAKRKDQENLDKGTKDVVPKGGGGGETKGDGPKNPRDAITQAMEETGFDPDVEDALT